MLKSLIGQRYPDLKSLKSDIEECTGKKVHSIIESESDRTETCDFMIYYEFEPFDIHTIWYLKDNGGNY